MNIGPQHVAKLLVHGDPTMWALLLCSIITVTFILERLVLLRTARVIPPRFLRQFREGLRDGSLTEESAERLCEANGSPMAEVFKIVVRHWGRPAAELRQAVSDRAESVTYHLRRRIRALGGIATMAPLLGLFGTVIGMIKAFHALGRHAGPGKTELLAEGIALALIATASGLAIAIVAAAGYYLIGGRVERIIQQMDEYTHEAIDYVACDGIARSERVARGDEEQPQRPRVVPPPKEATM
jgi:biopolymer transport protein ExbB